MCELMGCNFAAPVVADFSIREFAQRGEDNADGWGLAWYPDRSLAVIKEAGKWRASLHSGFLETYAGLRSTIVVAHVRHMTAGKAVRSDTHPFARESGGVEYCFAHNGTLRSAFDLPLGRFRPIGTTDSEHFFCHLLDEIAGWPKALADPDSWPRLHQKLLEFNRGGTLNMLLSDGRRLICYHDASAWKGLCFRKVVIHDQESRRFEDIDLRVDLGATAVNFGVVVATSPLSSSGWEKFAPGEMLVLDGGVIRWSSHRGNLAVFELTRAS
jgi:glutamine amidotransferase